MCASFNRATDLKMYPIGAGQVDYGGSELVQQLLTESEGNPSLIFIHIYNIYFVAYIEFAVLNFNYSTLLQSFPEDHGLTLNTLIDHFTDEQVTFILDSTGALAANQKMLNFLIGQLTEKADIIPLCDSLDKIGNATLSQAVEKLRNGNSVFYTTARSYTTVV